MKIRELPCRCPITGDQIIISVFSQEMVILGSLCFQKLNRSGLLRVLATWFMTMRVGV